MSSRRLHLSLLLLLASVLSCGHDQGELSETVDPGDVAQIMEVREDLTADTVAPDFGAPGPYQVRS